MTSSELQVLQGWRLNAIVFVLDYLQIQLENCVVTFSEYPEAIVENEIYRFGDSHYRNMICSFIGKVVLSVSYQDDVCFALSFKGGGRIQASLLPERYTSPEMGVVSLEGKSIVI